MASLEKQALTSCIERCSMLHVSVSISDQLGQLEYGVSKLLQSLLGCMKKFYVEPTDAQETDGDGDIRIRALLKEYANTLGRLDKQACSDDSARSAAQKVDAEPTDAQETDGDGDMRIRALLKECANTLGRLDKQACSDDSARSAAQKAVGDSLSKGRPNSMILVTERQPDAICEVLVAMSDAFSTWCRDPRNETIWAVFSTNLSQHVSKLNEIIDEVNLIIEKYAGTNHMTDPGSTPAFHGWNLPTSNTTCTTAPSDASASSSSNKAVSSTALVIGALLMNITLDNAEVTCHEIMRTAMLYQDEVEDEDLLIVSTEIFNAILQDHSQAALYAHVCKHLMVNVTANVCQDTVSGAHLFRKYLLHTCQDSFRLGTEGDDGWIDDLPKMGCFIGELYKVGIITRSSAHEYVRKVMQWTDRDLDKVLIATLYQLLRIVGPMFALDGEGRLLLRGYFMQLRSLIEMVTPGAHAQINILLWDLMGMRHGDWAPETLQENTKALSLLSKDIRAKGRWLALSGAGSNKRTSASQQ